MSNGDTSCKYCKHVRDVGSCYEKCSVFRMYTENARSIYKNKKGLLVLPECSEFCERPREIGFFEWFLNVIFSRKKDKDIIDNLENENRSLKLKIAELENEREKWMIKSLN